MRWFTSFFITVSVVGIVSGLFWLRQNPVGSVDEVSRILTFVIPKVVYEFVRRFQYAFIFGCWTAVVTLLSWYMAYIASATEASPRGRSHRSNPILETAHLLFHNPTRWWMGLFTLMIGVLVAATGAYVMWFERSAEAKLAWSLTALFGVTLVTAMAAPDRPHRLRITGEAAPDPRLSIPGLESMDADRD